MKKPRKKHVCPLRRVHPPDVLAEARHLYEQTRTPVVDIRAMLGLSETGFYRRVARFGWVKRQKNPALLPHLSKSRPRAAWAHIDTPAIAAAEIPFGSACGYSCGGLAACKARQDIFNRLIACAQRQEKIVDAVYQAFLALGGPPHQRQTEGHAWLMRELSGAQDTLRALAFVTRPRQVMMSTSHSG